MSVTVHHHKQKEAHDFLKNHKLGVLATVDPDGDPDAAAIYFTVDNSLNASFLTKSQTKKADNLQHNNHAVLIVYDATTQTTVQLTGIVSKITDAAEVNAVFAQVVYASIDANGNSLPPIAKLEAGDYVAYQLKPSQVRMAVFSRPATGNYSELFKTIVPEDK
jgi:general stress protein 26